MHSFGASNKKASADEKPTNAPKAEEGQLQETDDVMLETEDPSASADLMEGRDDKGNDFEGMEGTEDVKDVKENGEHLSMDEESNDETDIEDDWSEMLIHDYMYSSDTENAAEEMEVIEDVEHIAIPTRLICNVPNPEPFFVLSLLEEDSEDVF